MRLTLALALLLMLGLASVAEARRAPTYLERVTIMDAFNIPERSFASKCVRILVSTANPRYAMVTSPVRTPAACRRAGQVGNGYALFLRSTPRALRWRNIAEGNLEPPCEVPRNVRIDLFGSPACD